MSELPGWFDLGFIMGARGWDHDQWCVDFYPDDLPPEWRLGYYANEFPGVLVPEAFWSGVAGDEWSDWCDELPDGFCFYLELSTLSAPLLAQLAACQASIGSLLKGVLLTDQRKGVNQQLLESLSVPCFTMEAADVDDGARRLYLLSGGRLGHCLGLLLDSGRPLDLARTRQLLESIEGDRSDKLTPMLFVGGKMPDLDYLRRLRTLLELMGVA